MEYTHKYHTTAAANMTTAWLGQRLYRPSLEEMLRGALTPETPDVHYVSLFRYPTQGGFISYLNPFFDRADLHLAHQLVRIDPAERTLHFSNGAACRYRGLVSSIPLPELVPLIDGAPPNVVNAAGRLACTTAVVVNLGVSREDLSAAHWSYFYDRDISITRVNFPHMLSPHNAPRGHGTIQAEIYYSKKYRPIDRAPEEHIAPVIADLRRCGLLRDSDEVVFREARVIPYANIIFDHDREPALAIVHGYLEEIGIASCGRYGEWGYLWTDESFLSGERAAQRTLERLRLQNRAPTAVFPGPAARQFSGSGHS
jgi:protoporphyrinogen oxidase